MITTGIVIEWLSSTEYVPLDLSTADSNTKISATKEWWHDEQMLVEYSTVSSVTKSGNGDIVISLRYEPAMNPLIQGDDWSWGTSLIKIPANRAKGTASWADKGRKERSGTAPCRVLGPNLLKKSTKKTVSVSERNQAAFRAALLCMDKCCAVTGEDTASALEAAHIIPSKEGGAEVPRNGILLRADIHRLYDSGAFEIDLNGRVVKVKNLSSEYSKLLNNKSLRGPTLERISEALRVRRGEIQPALAVRRPRLRLGRG